MSTNEPDGGWPPPPPPPPPPTPPQYPPSGQYPPPGEPGQPPYAQPYGQTYAPPYGQPPSPYGYGYDLPPQNEGMAVGALVCAIAAWFTVWMTCLPIAAVAALFLASAARKRIDASGGRLTGAGMVTASKWIAWINIVVWALAALLFVGFAIFGALSDSAGSDFSLALLPVS